MKKKFLVVNGCGSACIVNDFTDKIKRKWLQGYVHDNCEKIFIFDITDNSNISTYNGESRGFLKVEGRLNWLI